MCYVDETAEQARAQRGARVPRPVRRCHPYDPARYAPVLVEGSRSACGAQLLNKRGPGPSAAVEVGPNPLPHVRRRDDDLDEEVIEDDDVRRWRRRWRRTLIR